MSSSPGVSIADLAKLNAIDLTKAKEMLVRVQARIEAARKRGATSGTWLEQEERVVQAFLMLEVARKAFTEESR